MIKSAIEKIEKMATTNRETEYVELGGKKGIRIGNEIIWEKPDAPRYPCTLEFHTLQSLCDYITQKYDVDFMHGQAFLHVESPYTVRLLCEAEIDYGNRCSLAVANCLQDGGQMFGKWLSGEEFMIKIQALFAQGAGDWDAVTKACAGIKKQEGVEYKDNGVTQTVAVQSGVSLATTKKLPNPVELAPYRTFAEIEQPVSKFILRVTDSRGEPQIGLFEADGGTWKIEAVSRIAKWLKEHQSLPVLA